MKKEKNFVVDETGYVPKHILEKAKKHKEERQKKIGKVVKSK